MLTSAKLRGPWYQKLYFLKLHMNVYLRAKFQVSIISLRSFRQGGNFIPPPNSKRTPKKPTQIRIKELYYSIAMTFTKLSQLNAKHQVEKVLYFLYPWNKPSDKLSVE